MPANDSGIPANCIADAMVQALLAAGRWRGSTSPNPPVGAVVLAADGTILAAAAHERAGGPHAEARALQTCREQGSFERAHTVVVTLEPCNHHGRTPPCCDTILVSPVRFVWVGSNDPNPQVAGKGCDRLSAQGLVVTPVSDLQHELSAELAARCASLIAPFATHVLKGRPWITIKQALDETGSMIPPTGQKTFTSGEALRLAHDLRRRADAVVTGSGTVLADNPLFTVRHVEDFPGKRRSLYVVDRRKRVSQDYFASAIARGFDAVRVAGVDEALRHAHGAGALEVLMEAGPTLVAHVLAEGLWDEHVVICKGADVDSVHSHVNPLTATAKIGGEDVLRNH